MSAAAFGWRAIRTEEVTSPMTERDNLRVAKALQGVDFPAERDQLTEYAAERGANPKTLQALRAISGRTYHSVDDVIGEVPQEPEGNEPGGTARDDARQSPTHTPTDTGT